MSPPRRTILVVYLACLVLGGLLLFSSGAHALTGEGGKGKEEGEEEALSARADCATDVFVPTADFQLVCDGQAIPPGLHVRLNLETGRKEARLVDAGSSNDDDGPGQPSDAVIVLDESSGATVRLHQGTEEGEEGEVRAMVDRSGKSPPAYSNVGRILPPQDRSEMALFQNSVDAVTSATALSAREDTLRALEHLEELSHDIYYGVVVVKNAELVRALLDLTGSDESDVIRAMAPLALGNALQNSPSALDAIRRSETKLTEEILALLETEKVAKVQERLVFVLGQLVRAPESLDEFVDVGGLNRLLKVFDADNTAADQSDGLRRRCAAFISDNFLDEEMNALQTDRHGGPGAREGGGQHFLGLTTGLPALDDWCQALQLSFDRLKGQDAESGRAREAIEAALRFPQCQKGLR
ncbi:MAG: hypothetical protein M1815_002734 [Lichina confinis]|nr:MAG: hypothetical protein M1815_002734 [Lichina confinis]